MVIFPSHRMFLRFVMAGQHYQYTVLPFGLSLAPWVFTKCMTVVEAYLRKRGIHVFPHLNDWLVRDKSRDQVLCHGQFTLCLFNHLSLILNKGKSTLIPMQKIDIIGPY